MHITFYYPTRADQILGREMIRLLPRLWFIKKVGSDRVNAPLLKSFDTCFSKTPSRNSMFIHLVYNEDKITLFLYLNIYFNYMHIVQKVKH